MKEHYVSYSQAVALKRLGFAEKVNHAYLKKISIEPEVSVGDLKEVHSKDPKNYNDNRKGAEKGQFFYSAPRLDQAAEWVRDCKGLHVSPDPYLVCDYDTGGSVYYERYLWSFELKKIPSGDYMKVADGGEYESYDEALSAGIDKALELLGKEVNNGM